MSAALTTRIPIKDARGNVIEEKEVATYAGLLSRAHEEGLSSVVTALVQVPTEENRWMAIASAVVETKKGRFTGIGDACPSNVNQRIVPHIIRMAETRAKARALRDAVNIGVVSLEELGGDDSSETVDEREVFPRGNTRQAEVRRFPDRERSGDEPPRTPEREPQRDVPRGRHNDRERGNHGNGITENQRRWLYRSLADRGYEGQRATDELCLALGVGNVNDATKQAASRLIDDWSREGSRAA